MRSLLSTACGALGLALMLAACTPMAAKPKTAPPQAVALAPKPVAMAAKPMPAAKPAHHRKWKHHHRWKHHHAWKRHHTRKHRHYAWRHHHHKWRHWHWRRHRLVRLPRKILHPYYPPSVRIDERF